MSKKNFEATRRFSLNLHRLGIHQLSTTHRMLLALFMARNNPKAIVPKHYTPKIVAHIEKR